MVAALTACTGSQAAGQASILVAGTSRGASAVESSVFRAARIDILQNIHLTDAGPVLIVAAILRAHRAESRPVAQAVGGIRLLDRGCDLQHTASRGREITALRLNAPGGPGTVRIDRGNIQVIIAIEIDIAGRVAHRLDLAGAPVRRAARIACPGILDPVGG